MKQFYRFTPGLLALTVALLGVSCVTTTQQDSFAGYPPLPFFWDYRIGGINVTIDRIKEESIVTQLQTIIQTSLDGEQNYAVKGETLFLDINAEQRSFMHDVDLYNAIYLSCVIRDGTGRIYARENEYIAGKRSLAAASEQYRIMKRVLGRLLAQRDERYKALEKYRKEHEN
jgi:hypothetical protein